MNHKLESSKLIARHPFLFLEVVVRSLVIGLALRFTTLQKISSLCARSRRKILIDPQVLHRFSLTLERRISPSCLRSSLVIFSMLPQGKFIVGVDKKNAELEAHAWVETQGAVYSGSLDWNRYQAIWSVQK